MPKCELCEEFDPRPRESDLEGVFGWCNKFNEPRRLGDSCNAGEMREEGR